MHGGGPRPDGRDHRHTIETAADSTINGLSYLSATYVVSGTDLVETGTCPTTVMNTYQFSVNTTAGVTTITLISPGARRRLHQTVNANSLHAALVAILLLGVGCGSSAAKTDAATDAPAATDAALDGGGDALDGGACNAIAQLADPVTTSCDPGAPPAAAGGTIADGTYVLTESHFFGSCESNVLSETLVIAQGTCNRSPPTRRPARRRAGASPTR